MLQLGLFGCSAGGLAAGPVETRLHHSQISFDETEALTSKPAVVRVFVMQH